MTRNNDIAAAWTVAFDPRLGELRQQYVELQLEAAKDDPRPLPEPGYLKKAEREYQVFITGPRSTKQERMLRSLRGRDQR